MDGIGEFEEYFRMTYDRMLGFCKFRRGRVSDAEEIVTEAYARMWRAWERCSAFDPARRNKWMFNTIDYIIREESKKRRPKTVSIDADPDGDGDTFPATASDEMADGVTRAFEDMKYELYVGRIESLLSKRERELFDCVIVRQLTYGEASAELGRSLTVIYAQMARIRAKIRAHKDEIFE